MPALWGKTQQLRDVGSRVCRTPSPGRPLSPLLGGWKARRPCVHTPPYRAPAAGLRATRVGRGCGAEAGMAVGEAPDEHVIDPEEEPGAQNGSVLILVTDTDELMRTS